MLIKMINYTQKLNSNFVLNFVSLGNKISKKNEMNRIIRKKKKKYLPIPKINDQFFE